MDLINCIRAEAAEAGSVYERIFGLDAQLFHDVVWTALAMFILFFALSYLLFNPARKLLNDRKKKIADELKDAETHLSEAEAMKATYDEKLRTADNDAAAILDDARRKALISENNILEEAREEADRIRERALRDIEREKRSAEDDLKQEMVSLASSLAGKVLSKEVDAAQDEALFEETLNEIGNVKWQDQ
ncbi:MAG: F0F1 ATP synthase subunit B [Lachnospiraceae bacterium]|nr:F0F1 ATP synthase subunit B [Lachnospiraceae bacterium]